MTLPTVLTEQFKEQSSVDTLKVFAQDETRLGLLPVVRRRMTACGGQPVATVTPQFDNFYLYGAVAPTAGDSFLLALPYLTSRAFQVWVDGFAAALPASLNLLGLDNGAGHKAKAVRWPSNVVPCFCLPTAQNSIQWNGSGVTSKTSWLPSLHRLSRPYQRPCALSSKTTLR
jgi:hypothetical protein